MFCDTCSVSSIENLRRLSEEFWQNFEVFGGISTESTEIGFGSYYVTGEQLRFFVELLLNFSPEEGSIRSGAGPGGHSAEPCT